MAISLIMFSSTGIIASAALVLSPVLASQAGEGDVDPGKTYYFTSSTLGQPKAPSKPGTPDAKGGQESPKGDPKGGPREMPGGKPGSAPKGKGGDADHGNPPPKGDSPTGHPQDGKPRPDSPSKGDGHGRPEAPKGGNGKPGGQPGKGEPSKGSDDHGGKDGKPDSKRPVSYTWGGAAPKGGHDDSHGKGGSRDDKDDSRSGNAYAGGDHKGDGGRGDSERDGLEDRGKRPTVRYVGTPKAHRGEIVTERGKTFRDCELIEADGHGLTFRHRDGMAKIGYGDMNHQMQKEFGYDPEVAKQERRDRVEKMRHQWGGNVHGGWKGGGSHGSGHAGAGGSYLGAQLLPSVSPAIGTYYTARAGSTNPAFATHTLGQILDYRYNGYSNISLSEQLYNQHFAAHSGAVYRNPSLRPAVIAAPAYLPYVRNIYPRQIGTFGAGPSGGSLVPTLRSGYSQKGAIAPSLVPAPRR